MRLKLLRDIRMKGSPQVQLLKGTVLEVSNEIAVTWCIAGAAVPVKEGIETAMLAKPPEKAVTDSVTEKKREQTRERVKRYREKKALQPVN